MVGEFSNFMKSFGKAFDYIKDSSLLDAGKLLYNPILAEVKVFYDLNKIDYEDNLKDKIADGIKGGLDIVGMVPGVGTAIETVGDAVADTASYLTDIATGKKDAPPKGANINSNIIGDLPHNVLSSTSIQIVFGFGGGGLW
jgi:hypothetical protein